MALQLRRGLDAARTAITPAEGEILYVTDTKKVWVVTKSAETGQAVPDAWKTYRQALRDVTVRQLRCQHPQQHK
jgi:hypothetical protein